MKSCGFRGTLFCSWSRSAGTDRDHMSLRGWKGRIRGPLGSTTSDWNVNHSTALHFTCTAFSTRYKTSITSRQRCGGARYIAPTARSEELRSNWLYWIWWFNFSKKRKCRRKTKIIAFCCYTRKNYVLQTLSNIGLKSNDLISWSWNVWNTSSLAFHC